MRLEHHLVGGYVRYISPYIIILLLLISLEEIWRFQNTSQQRAVFNLTMDSTEIKTTCACRYQFELNVMGNNFTMTKLFSRKIDTTVRFTPNKFNQKSIMYTVPTCTCTWIVPATCTCIPVHGNVFQMRACTFVTRSIMSPNIRFYVIDSWSEKSYKIRFRGFGIFGVTLC